MYDGLLTQKIFCYELEIDSSLSGTRWSRWMESNVDPRFSGVEGTRDQPMPGSFPACPTLGREKPWERGFSYSLVHMYSLLLQDMSPREGTCTFLERARTTGHVIRRIPVTLLDGLLLWQQMMMKFT